MHRKKMALNADFVAFGSLCVLLFLASSPVFAAIRPNTVTPSPTRFESLTEPVRLAQAQVTSVEEPFADIPIKGHFYFEQMPNSVIISYRLAGLLPKRDYQIFVKDQPGCEPADLSPATGLRALKGNRRRVSRNTFSNTEFSVTGAKSLLGKTIVITTRENAAEMSRTIPLACGTVTALNPMNLQFEKTLEE